jgi:predicted RNase H-like HicB family nuclease
MPCVKQSYHTIIKPTQDGWYVGWVEEVPGTITYGRSLEECRDNLRDALSIMLESIRSEARIGLDASCIQERLDVEVEDEALVMV